MRADGSKSGRVAHKPDSVLVNFARGEIINGGRPRRCAPTRSPTRRGIRRLYVGEFEPLPPTRLWSDPRVLITPHVSGASEEDRYGAIDQFCDNLRAYLAVRPLRNVIDWERGY